MQSHADSQRRGADTEGTIGKKDISLKREHPEETNCQPQVRGIIYCLLRQNTERL